MINTKYRKSILPAIYNYFILLPGGFLLFALCYQLGLVKTGIIILLFCIILLTFLILDNYLDYLKPTEKGLIYHEQKMIFSKSDLIIDYKNISGISTNQTFWKNLFGLGDIIIKVESSEQIYKDISGYKECVVIIKNELGI